MEELIKEVPKTCSKSLRAQSNKFAEIWSSSYDFISHKMTNDDARGYCQSKGFHWDLVIINSKAENLLLGRILTDGCSVMKPREAFWVGFNEVDSEVSTIFGHAVDWSPKWARGNVAQKGEECVVFANGQYHHAACDDGLEAAFICEKHNYLENCQEEQFSHPNYYVGFNAGLNWEEAQLKCKARGDDWDLAVPNSEYELNTLTKLANCGLGHFWLGMQNTLSGTFTYFDKNILSPGFYSVSIKKQCFLNG